MQRSSVLAEMIEAGDAVPPAEFGMPDELDAAPGVESLSESLIAQRDDDRRRLPSSTD